MFITATTQQTQNPSLEPLAADLFDDDIDLVS
jgi:hypothetical protein